MAVKVSKFLHNLLLQANPLSQRFNPDNLQEARPKRERDLIDVMALGTAGEWIDDVGEWQEPPEQELL